VVGKVGAGKSTLINKVLQENVCESSVTKKTEQVTRNLHINGNDYQCTFINTIGLFNKEVNTNEGIVQDITEAINSVGELNLFLIVFRYGRFTMEEREAMYTCLNSFNIHQIAALVITHCDGIGEKARAHLVENFKQNNITEHFAAQMSRGIYTVGFPDLELINEGFRQLCEKTAQKDRSKLHQLIAASSATMPAQDIIKDYMTCTLI